jgi:hypothetical protein
VLLPSGNTVNVAVPVSPTAFFNVITYVPGATWGTLKLVSNVPVTEEVNKVRKGNADEPK